MRTTNRFPHPKPHYTNQFRLPNPKATLAPNPNPQASKATTWTQVHPPHPQELLRLITTTITMANTAHPVTIQLQTADMKTIHTGLILDKDLHWIENIMIDMPIIIVVKDNIIIIYHNIKSQWNLPGRVEMDWIWPIVNTEGLHLNCIRNLFSCNSSNPITVCSNNSCELIIMGMVKVWFMNQMGKKILLFLLSLPLSSAHFRLW